MAGSLNQEGISIIEKYFKQEFALTRHHIDSYEQCIFNEIPTIIQATNPIVFLKEQLDSGVFAYRVEIYIGGLDGTSITISPPVVSLDGGRTIRRMFPNEARLRNLTYYSQFNVDIQIRVIFTKKLEAGGYSTETKDAPLIRSFPLFRLPILLRSRLCPTSVADSVRLHEMGECYNDYGGYFVIGGAEKILITREEQAFNSLYIAKKPDSDEKQLAYASVVSLHPETKQTRRVALFVMRSGEIRVSVPMVRGSIPVFILFRAFGVESDEDIVRLIFPDPLSSDAIQLESQLVEAIHDAYPILNQYLAIKYIMSLTKGFTEAHVLDILQNLLLPHVPEEARPLYLAEMVREALRAGAGLRPNTDRDDMRNQRFLTTGTLVRELFNASWKDWRAEVIMTIDRTYRRNEQLYQGEHVFDLFADSNLITMFQPATLNNAIMRGYRGRWGTNESNEKTGVLQPLAKISYLDAMSHTRRVVSEFDTGSKATGPRKLHTSQIGYFCTSETPTGGHIGVTKNMSILTQFSLSSPTKAVYDWLRIKGGVIPVPDTTATLRATACTVQINGGTIGFTLEPRPLVRVLRLMKWNSCLAPSASISFSTTDRTVRIYLDEGRPIRPLWHLNGEGVAFLDRLETLRSLSWSQLVYGTFPATAGSSLRSTRFIDPLSDQPNASFADYENALKPTAGFIEYCDPMEMNEAYVSWYGDVESLLPEHTHCEIHPSTMQGLLASMIPFSNHNQAPRNQLSCSQSKQGISYMATNIESRYDSNAHQLCYGEAPLCSTVYYKSIGGGKMTYGSNCIIAATSETGYNQDDGLIINSDSVARGLFQNLSFRTYDCPEEVDPLTKTHTHVANPASVPTWSSLRPGYDYSKLDDRGIIREGEVIDDKTVLVGRYMVIPDTNDIKDVSVVPGLYTEGRVDSVVVLHQTAEGDTTRLLVKVRIIKVRMPGLGDKFSSRHGQKGTIGMLVPSTDLPRTAEGLVPDVMVNPGGLISRMTVAQLVEMVAGKAAMAAAGTMNATAFCNGGDFVQQLGDMLQSMGIERTGDEVLYSGITGQQVRTNIFMCPLYFMRLKHLTDDKLNARGEGRREIRTHQPTGGRANEGGLRIGEMERDSLCAHGVSAFLQESMMKRGDATDFFICNGCGRIPIYNEPEKLFVCPTCDGPLSYTGVSPDTLTMLLPTKQSRTTFSKIAMPYAMKLLDQEITTFMNAGFRFVTESSIGRLRDSAWEWPTMDVEFKVVDRGIKAEVLDPEAKAAAAAAAAAKKPSRKKSNARLALAVPTAPLPNAPLPNAPLPVAQESIQFGAKLDNEYLGFSNHASAAFRINGSQIPAPDGHEYANLGTQTWPTVEHYYQAMKFPSDNVWQNDILRADTPFIAKKMGLDRAHPLRGDWDQIKERVMKSALLEKFKQNPPSLYLLQETGLKKLVEVNKADLYWGSGPIAADGTFKGQNRMGALLEEVRRELKDIRVDLQARGGGAGSAPYVAETGDEVNSPANIVADANAAVELAGVRLATIPEATENSESNAAAKTNQQGGVYLFINSAVGGYVEPKARRARHSGPPRHISWDGQDSQSSQSGGGEQMTIDSANTVEVKVEKLG
jgi:DNA-directed RNA polymerase II subunit RPB2